MNIAAKAGEIALLISPAIAFMQDHSSFISVYLYQLPQSTKISCHFFHPYHQKEESAVSRNAFNHSKLDILEQGSLLITVQKFEKFIVETESQIYPKNQSFRH